MFGVPLMVWGVLLAGAVIAAYGFFCEKRSKKKLGEPPLVPPFFWQFLGLLMVLIGGAELFSQLSGLDWRPPNRPY